MRFISVNVFGRVVRFSVFSRNEPGGRIFAYKYRTSLWPFCETRHTNHVSGVPPVLVQVLSLAYLGFEENGPAYRIFYRLVHLN